MLTDDEDKTNMSEVLTLCYSRQYCDVFHVDLNTFLHASKLSDS